MSEEDMEDTGMEGSEREQARAKVPQCCPYCSDSKYPCVKMERAIKRAVAEELGSKDED